LVFAEHRCFCRESGGYRLLKRAEPGKKIWSRSPTSTKHGVGQAGADALQLESFVADVAECRRIFSADS
jgi:hypothetical protein